jgi:hypothetical protein
MFGWFIWVFIFLILLGNERSGFVDSCSWRNNYYNGIFTGRNRKNQTDFEIRRQLRKQALSREPEIIVVKPDDHIGQPDHHLESLIREGKLDEAREYRVEMEKIAEEMENDESLRKYAIYGARISKRHKELQRVKTRKKYRAFADPPWAKDTGSKAEFVGQRSVPGTDTIKAAGVISTVSTSSTSRDAVPPLWGARKKAAAAVSGPSRGMHGSIPRLREGLRQSIPKDTDQLTPIGRPLPGKKVEAEKPVVEPVRHIKPPEPPRPVSKSEPVPPVIPEDFTLPLAGPVQLGGSDRYKAGPLKSEKVKDSKQGDKKKKSPADKKIDPDEFNDLISF